MSETVNRVTVGSGAGVAAGGDATADARKPPVKKVNLMKKLIHHLQADALRIRSVDHLSTSAAGAPSRSSESVLSSSTAAAAASQESKGLKKVRSLFRRETTTANGLADVTVALREIIQLRHLLSCASRPAMIRSSLDPNDTAVPAAVVATADRSTVDTLAEILPDDVLVVISSSSSSSSSNPSTNGRGGKETRKPSRGAAQLDDRLICMESATTFALPQSTELMDRLFPGGIRTVAALLNAETDEASQVDGVLRESAVGLVAALASRLMSQGSRYSAAVTHAVVPDSANAIVSLWRNRKVGRMFFRSVTAIASAVRCTLVPSFFRTMVCCAVACQGRFFTVTWAPPICSTMPLDVSLSGMATAAVELIVSAMTGSTRSGVRHSIVEATSSNTTTGSGTFAMPHGQQFVTSAALIALQDTVRLLPCADSTYVVLPGTHLLQFLQTQRCEGVLLTPVIGGGPMQRLHSTLLRLINSETVESLTRALGRSDAEKHTFLSKLFHFHGVRMLELMRVRHFLHRLVATETTSDTFLDVRDFFVKWILNEVVSRVLKGMILSQSNPAAAARLSSIIVSAASAVSPSGLNRSGRSGSMSLVCVTEGNFVASAATVVYRKFLTSETFLADSLLPQVAQRFPSEEETIFVKEELDGPDVVAFLKHRLGLNYHSLTRQFSLQRSSMSFSVHSSEDAAEENATEDRLSSNESVVVGRGELDPASLVVPPTLLGYTNRDALVASSAPMLKSSSEALATAVHYHASTENESAILSAALALSVFYGAASVALKLSQSDATFAVAVQMLPLRGRKVNLLVIHVIAQLRRILGCQKLADKPKLPQSSSVSTNSVGGRSVGITTSTAATTTTTTTRLSEAKLLVAIPVAMWDAGHCASSDRREAQRPSVAGLVLRSVADTVWLNRLLIRSCDPLVELDVMMISGNRSTSSNRAAAASSESTARGGGEQQNSGVELSHDSRLTLLWSQALAGCEHEHEELVALFDSHEPSHNDDDCGGNLDSAGREPDARQGSVSRASTLKDGMQTPGAMTVLSTMDSLSAASTNRSPQSAFQASTAGAISSAAAADASPSNRSGAIPQCCNRVLAMNEGVAKAFLSLILSRNRWNRLLQLFTTSAGPSVSSAAGVESSTAVGTAALSDEAPKSFILFLEGILVCASALVVAAAKPSSSAIITTKPQTPPQPHGPRAHGRRESSARVANGTTTTVTTTMEISNNAGATDDSGAARSGVIADGREMTRGELFQWSCNLLCFLGISGPMTIARFAAEGNAKQQMLVIEVVRALAEDDPRGWLLLLLLNPERQRQYLYRCCRESLHQFMWTRFQKNPAQFGDLPEFLRRIFSSDSVFVMSLLEREAMRQRKRRRLVPAAASNSSTGPRPSVVASVAAPRGREESSRRSTAAVVTFDERKVASTDHPPFSTRGPSATARPEDSTDDGAGEIKNTTNNGDSSATAAAAESAEADDIETDDPVLSKWATELAAQRFSVFMNHVNAFSADHLSKRPHVIVPQNKKNVLGVEVAELRLSLPFLQPALDDGSFICPRCQERFRKRRQKIEAEIEEKLKSKKPAHKFDHQPGAQARSLSEAGNAASDQGDATASATEAPCEVETTEATAESAAVPSTDVPAAQESVKSDDVRSASGDAPPSPPPPALRSDDASPIEEIDLCVRRSNSLPEMSTHSARLPSALSDPSAAPSHRATAQKEKFTSGSKFSRSLDRPHPTRHQAHTADGHLAPVQHLAAVRGVPPRYRLRPQPPATQRQHIGGEVPTAFRMYAASQRKMLLKSEEEHHPWFLVRRGRSLGELRLGIRNSIYVELGDRSSLLDVLGAGDDTTHAAHTSSGVGVRLPAVSPRGPTSFNSPKSGLPQTSRANRFENASATSDFAIKLRLLARQEESLRAHTVDEEARERFALSVMRVAIFSARIKGRSDTLRVKKPKSGVAEPLGLTSFEL